MIRRVFAAGEQLSDDVPVVYLEEHDMALGKLLCSGVDLWLNNPQKPMEASGTSGMKAALNGVPSLSVLDGWWPEGWIEGVTGWSIGDGAADEDRDAREHVAVQQAHLRHPAAVLRLAGALYGRVMRSTIAINGAYFTAQRMLQQYVGVSLQRSPPPKRESGPAWPKAARHCYNDARLSTKIPGYN